jgi:hypothetical protein
VAENEAKFILDVAQEADEEKDMRCPSTYRVGAQMLLSIATCVT